MKRKSSLKSRLLNHNGGGSPLAALLVLSFASHVACSLEERPDPPEPPIGKKLVYDGEGRKDVYTFCPQTVEVEFKHSPDRPHIQEGTWKRSGEEIIIHWNLERGGRGQGKPVGECPDCIFPSYRAFSHALDEEQRIPWKFIQENPFGDWDISDHARPCPPSTEPEES
ncbi:MAG: hypothetical protein KDK25_06860 [Leptospiraceae bacterium]|nr:hypothetical protein [Leptospiraceae bacterium]